MFCQVVRGSDSIGTFVSGIPRFSTASFLACLMERNSLGWFFRSFLFNSDVTVDKFGKNWRNTLERPQMDLNSV